ncbi:thioredoxin [Micromonospora sp. NPDC049559]|uniref:thioredoxin n=1 Tax=Micromonospora sp. NPDC049559 TaxID=3155923 RepID=UPI00341B1B7D
MTTDVTDATFGGEVLASELPVLVEFWAEWCGPCHRLAPVLDELSAEYAGRARVVKINADENPETARAYGVSSMPTLSVFRAGEVVSQVVGAQPKSRLRAQIDSALSG